MFDKTGSKDWAKRKFKIKFARRDDFVWSKASGKVGEMHLHSSYDEPGPESYTREVLASRAMRKAGIAAAVADHVVLYQNGAFYGLYVLVENIDGAFLQRNGLDRSGALLKAVHWKYSNLRPLASGDKPCRFAPDWEKSYGACPEVYRYSGQDASKASAAHDALGSFIGSLHAVNTDTSSLFNSVDMDAVIKEMALQTTLLNQDRCTKNFYMYQSPASRTWRRIPWDLEDSMSTDYRSGTKRCNTCDLAAGTYCILTCEWWNSPVYCDARHPQDVFEKNGGRSTYNHLVDKILSHTRTRALYFAKLKEFTATFHTSGWLSNEANVIVNKIRSEAKRDAAKWGMSDIDQGLAALQTQLSMRRSQLEGTYAAMM